MHHSDATMYGSAIADSPHSKANEYARNHGLTQFCVYQGRWSAASRDFETDIIPMCREEGMGICPWGALGGGQFKTEEQRKQQEGRIQRNEEAPAKISKTLEAIAKRKNTLLTSVALAYVMHKTAYVFPIVGLRKVEHLQGNIEALSIELSPEDIKEIEDTVPFKLPFPHSMLWGADVPESEKEVGLLRLGGYFDYVPHPAV